MNANQNPDDPKLSQVVRAARPEPAMPPRFQESVWRRIAEAEALTRAETKASWLDALAIFVLRPRFAVAAAVLVIIAGAALGAHEAGEAARENAQARYLSVVAPNSLH